MSNHQCVAGIFVGGRGTRMRGLAKGLIQPPGTEMNLVEKLRAALLASGISEIVLVGQHHSYHGYPWQRIEDSPLGAGPMAGLCALLEHSLLYEYEYALAVACDMPYLDEAILGRLGREMLASDVVLPKREKWEPLCARYRAKTVLPRLREHLLAGRTRLSLLMDDSRLKCNQLSLEAADVTRLDDWDSPDDLPIGTHYLGKPFPNH